MDYIIKVRSSCRYFLVVQLLELLLCLISCEKENDFVITDGGRAKILSIDNYMDLSNVDQCGSRQGSALWNNTLFIFHNTNDIVEIYDLLSKSLKCVVDMKKLGLYNKEYHCNNVNFSNEKYDKNDTYPLLYVSMEHINQHKILVLRVIEILDDFKFELKQTIELPHPDTVSLYFPNSYIDTCNHALWVSGYTTKSYRAGFLNKLRYLKFDLPDHKNGETVVLSETEIKQVCVFDSVTATQGGVIKGGELHQLFGTQPPLYYYIFDLGAGKIRHVECISDLNNTEPEGVFFYGDVLFYSTQTQILSFRF